MTIFEINIKKVTYTEISLILLFFNLTSSNIDFMFNFLKKLGFSFKS